MGTQVAREAYGVLGVVTAVAEEHETVLLMHDVNCTEPVKQAISRQARLRARWSSDSTAAARRDGVDRGRICAAAGLSTLSQHLAGAVDVHPV